MFVVTLFLWLRWMKEPIISKEFACKSHSDHQQFLMHDTAYITPCQNGINYNSINLHLVFHVS